MHTSYHSPQSVSDTLDLLRKCGPAARILAGGQTLIPELRKRSNERHAVIDLGQLAELDFIRIESDFVRIGAMCRCTTAEQSSEVRNSIPLFAQVLSGLASRAIRNRSTIGGNLAQADRRSDICALSVLLGAEVNVFESDARFKTLSIEEFLLSRKLSTDNALLCELRVPITNAKAGVAFSRFAFHPHEHSLVSVGVSLTSDQTGVTSARIVIGGATERPGRVPDLEQMVVRNNGAVLSKEELARSLMGISFVTDDGANPDYSRHVLLGLVSRTLATASQRVKAST